jgi:outer membrane protein OmpA-like peptidoglycan-associated protein
MKLAWRKTQSMPNNTLAAPRLGFPIAIALSLAALACVMVLAGCTTKNYVRTQTAPLAQKTNELDDAAATNSRNLADVKDRTETGIANAQSAANTANQNAQTATAAAATAQQSAEQAVNRVSTLEGSVANLDSYKQVSDVAVYFGFDKADLTRDGREQLDSLGAQLGTTKGYILEITGGADIVGGADYNYQLSERRAQAVVQYLATKYNVPPHRIYLVGVGKDQAKATQSSGRAKDRKVQVRLLINMGIDPNARSGPSTSGM